VCAGDAVAPQTATASTSAVILVVVIIVFLLFLVIIDISCYFLNSCGVLMLICQHVCGKKPVDRHKQMEEGEK
jgi:neural cell adhesion molecule